MQRSVSAEQNNWKTTLFTKNKKNKKIYQINKNNYICWKIR